MCAMSEDINFLQLEKEFQSAQSADAKYRCENDAKFRAVHQKVSSYEEFQDIVKASHLSPVDLKEMNKSEKRNQPWNAYSSHNAAPTNKGGTGAQEDVSITNSTKGTVTCDNIGKRWKSLKNEEERFSFLLENSSSLEDALRLDIPVNFLEDVVKVVKGSVTTETAAAVVEVLDCFTRSKRFELALRFLSSADKVAIRDLLDMLVGLKIDVSRLRMAFRID